MPASFYRLMFKDPEMKKLAPSELEIGTYTTDSVMIVGSHRSYLVHLDSKKLVDVIFFVAINDGSVFLFCKTTLVLGLIQPRSRLDYLPHRASLITRSVDHQKKTKPVKISVHTSKQKAAAQTPITTIVKKQDVNKPITSKEQILTHYPGVFERTGRFPGPPYSIPLDPSIPPKQTPCHPVPVHLKESFKQEIDKMLKAGILKPVHEATPWINSFVLVEGKDKLGGLKLCICLDPTNLNKATIREPYHFKTLEDIAHLIAESCIMTVCDCKKGYWYQELDEASDFLTTFNMEIGQFRYTVMPFGATIAGDVFQCKLDQCFGHTKNVIVIADDIMVIGRQQNHRDHDQALTTLLETARKCNVRLNYDKLQYKKEGDFLGRLIPPMVACQLKAKLKQSLRCQLQLAKKVQSFIGMINYLSKFSARLSELAEPIRELCKDKVPFNWGPEYQDAFKLMKREIIITPILAYFNPRKTNSLAN